MRNDRGATIVVALLAAACADSAEPDVVSKTIGRGGGVVTSHDGVLTIVLQPDAVDEPVEIEVSPSVEPPPIFGPAYAVRPNIELAFQAEITYRRVLPEDVEGVAVAAVRLADYQQGDGHWDPLLPVLRVDTATNEVVGADSELSPFYGLLEDATPDDSSGGTDGGSESDGGDDTGTTVLSHAAHIQPIWNANCYAGADGDGTLCHGDASDTTLHELEFGTDAYPALMAMAVGANMDYVVPGSADESYLMHKLDGTMLDVGGSGGAMPLLRDPLPTATREFVRAWIEQGALP